MHVLKGLACRACASPASSHASPCLIEVLRATLAVAPVRFAQTFGPYQIEYSVLMLETKLSNQNRNAFKFHAVLILLVLDYRNTAYFFVFVMVCRLPATDLAVGSALRLMLAWWQCAVSTAGQRGGAQLHVSSLPPLRMPAYASLLDSCGRSAACARPGARACCLAAPKLM